MDIFIETGIAPLVNAINKFGFLRTIYSCEGHFDREPNEKFIPTAYVTFKTTNFEKFRHVYRQICFPNRSEVSTYLRMTYDCVFGLHTLSIWPDDSIINISEKRAVVDAAIRRLAGTVSDCAENSTSISMREEDAGPRGVHPCGELHPPCMLVIPQKELTCPFAEISD